MFTRRLLAALAIFVGAFALLFVRPAMAQLDPTTDREWQAVNEPGYHRVEIVTPPLPRGDDGGNYALRLRILPVAGERDAVIWTDDFGQEEILTDVISKMELTARPSAGVKVQGRYTNSRSDEFRTDLLRADPEWDTITAEFKIGDVSYVHRFELWFVVEGFDPGDTVLVDLDRLVYESTGPWGGRMVLDEFGTAPTGVAGEAPTAPATRVVLEQNAPNPFNPRTTIPFQVAETGTVNLAVYDVTGRKVMTLIDGPLSAGSHSAQWEGVDANGGPVPSGVYIARLTASGTQLTRRMLLVK